jgi:hypothetical protein
MKQPFDAIVWWEIRRIPYNLILLVAGILTIAIILFIGGHFVKPGEDVIEPLGMLFGGICYGIAANLLYTLSWITEILWSGGDTSRTQVLRSKVFRKGLIFSIIITFLPAVLIPAAWVIFGVR